MDEYEKILKLFYSFDKVWYGFFEFYAVIYVVGRIKSDFYTFYRIIHGNPCVIKNLQTNKPKAARELLLRRFRLFFFRFGICFPKTVLRY